jgi:anti-sigma factor RsiW
MRAPPFELPCEEWSATLHGLLDGELDAVHAMRCEKHLASCTGCAAELARLRVLRSIMSQDDVRWRAPETLRTKVLAYGKLRSDAGMGRLTGANINGWGRFMAAVQRWSLIPSLVVLAASLFIVYAPPNGERQLPDDLVAGHVRSLLADHLTDVASSNQHVVKPWFIGKLDFAPPVIDLREGAFPLIGGRVDYIDDHVVAALVYRHSSHIINLFIWPSKAAGTKTMTREGYNLMNWTQGGLTFWAITDLQADELKQFQQALTAAAPH